MKRVLTFILLLGTSIAAAQEPTPMPTPMPQVQAKQPAAKAAPRAAQPANRQAATASPSDKAPAGSVPPEMWYYQKELERYEDPKTAIRRNAEFRAAQRRLRIASGRWFGFSKSRPQAAPLPQMGTASPRWIGNGRNPNDWVGTDFGRSALFIYPGVYYR